MARNNRQPRKNNHLSSVKLLQRPDNGPGAFADASVDAFLLFDENLDLVSINPAGEKLLGVSLEADAGKNITQIVPDIKMIGRYEKYLSVIETGTPFFADDIIPHPRFGNKHLSIKAFKVWQGVGMIVSDITERKRVEEALRGSKLLATATIEEMADGVMLVEMDGTVAYVNKAFEKILGYKSVELVGTSAVALPTYRGSKDKKKAREALRKVIEKGSAEPIDMIALRKDGIGIPINFSASVVKDAKGNPKMLVAVIRDVTERRKAEEALRESEAKLKLYLDNSPDAIYILDAMGNFLYGNIAAEKAVGYSREEILGRNFVELSLLSDEQVLKAAQLHELNFAGKPTGPQEYELVRKDRSHVFVEISTYPMGEGAKLEVIGIARDITERKKMEEEVRRLSDAVRMTTDSIVVTDMRGNILDGNEASARMYGADSRADLMGMEAFDIIVPEDREKALEKMKLVMEKGYVSGLEYHILTRDGRKILVEASTAIMKGSKGEPIGFVGVSRDITERKRMEEELARSEAKYRSLIETAGAGVATIDLKGEFVLVNEALCSMLGYSREELLGKNFADFLYPDDVAGVLDLFSTGLEGNREQLSIEFRVVHKEGQIIWCYSSPTALINQNETIGFNAIIYDITKRKQAEDELKLSEGKYRLVIDNANEAILVAQDGMLRFFNTRVIEILGYSREELASKPFIEFIHSEDQAMVMGRYIARLEGKEVPPVYSFRVVGKTGNVRWVEISAVVFNWEGRPATLNFLTDITERKKAEEEKQRMEERLLLASRLAAVGELAAGVAHELNNPLAIIQMYSESFKENGDLDDTAKKDLLIIYEQAKRASKITRNLLSFARKHEPEKNMVSVNEIIEKTVEMRSHQLSINNIEVSEELQPDLPMIMADYYQMQQVFMNIIINAEQAMLETHGRGKLNIKTETTEGAIKISFTDDGPGISEGNLKRIFDPFFTTKEVGKGTGLGLSICYGIVQAHGGHIYAISKMGEGATFVIEIPITSDMLGGFRDRNPSRMIGA